VSRPFWQLQLPEKLRYIGGGNDGLIGRMAWAPVIGTIARNPMNNRMNLDLFIATFFRIVFYFLQLRPI
jgi:hypothetical protein